MRVGRALEDLGYAWFEEPVQHYHVARHGRGRAAPRHHCLGGRADLYPAGPEGPDQGRRAHGAAGHRQDGRHHRPDAMRGPRARARRASSCRIRPSPRSATLRTCTCSRRSCISPSPSSLPTIGSARARCSRTRPSRRTAVSTLPTAPGLGMVFDEAEMKRRSIPVARHEAPQRTGEDETMTLTRRRFLGAGLPQSAPPRRLGYSRRRSRRTRRSASPSRPGRRRASTRSRTASPAATTGRSGRFSTRSRRPKTAPSASGRRISSRASPRAGRRSEDAKVWTYKLRRGVQVPQGLRRDDGGRRPLHLRPPSRPEDRHQPEAALLREHRQRRRARPLHGALRAQAARSAVQRQRHHDAFGSTSSAARPSRSAATTSTSTRSAPAPTRSKASARPKGIMLSALRGAFRRASGASRSCAFPSSPTRPRARSPSRPDRST